VNKAPRLIGVTDPRQAFFAINEAAMKLSLKTTIPFFKVPFYRFLQISGEKE
jgi:hypothetical protein